MKKKDAKKVNKKGENPGSEIIPRVITQIPHKKKLHKKQAEVLDKTEEIIQWLNWHYPIRRIAYLMRVSSKTVEKIKKQEKIRGNPKGRPITRETEAKRRKARDEELRKILAHAKTQIDDLELYIEYNSQEIAEIEKRTKRLEEENAEYMPVGNPEKHVVKRKPRIIEERGKYSKRFSIEE